MKVFHISKTPVAGAAGLLNRVINKYTSWDSDVHVQRLRLSAGDFSVDYLDNIPHTQIQQKVSEADILHFHNCGPNDFNINSSKPFIIQLHSEPRVRRMLVDRYPGKCITICQKHALLYREIQSNFPCVPNIIPINEKAYLPFYEGKKVVTVFYAPSSTVSLPDYTNTCSGKGYKETVNILNKISKEFGKRVNVIIKTRTAKKEVLAKKQHADIVIDECVTGGYHLSSLEALSMGCITIAYLTPAIENIIRKISGCYDETLPWVNTQIPQLYSTLESLIRLKQERYDKFHKLRKASRIWMETYWNPEKLVERYIDLYVKTLGLAEDEKSKERKISVLESKPGQYPIEVPNTKKSSLTDPWKNLGVSSNLAFVRAKRKQVYIKYDALQKEYEIPVNDLRKKHNTQSALIMGGGPSVARVDLEYFLKRKESLKLNCNFFFKGFGHTPDYWFNIDSTCLVECLRNLNQRVPIIINPPLRYQAMGHKRSFISKAKSAFDSHFNMAFEVERPCTVATIMTLYAMWMGCNPIYIIGVDLSLGKSRNNYFYSDKANNSVYNDKFRDFRNNYYHIINEFKMMKEYADRHNIKIFNLDPEPQYFNMFQVYK